MKTVGVIGAGAAGLCALRHLRDVGGVRAVLWEGAATVGGTWVYQQGAGLDSRGLPIHSSMYKSLRTNLPKEVMAFPDFPFKAGGESFLHHTEVLQYLKDYTKHYGLEADIKFEHLVEHVVPSVPGDPGTGWHVTVRDLRDGGTSSTLCDALMVCNGHYSVPAQPDVPGMERFAGITQHSHSYREPSRYAGKTVIVLGASASGVDISLELSGVAETVYLSHNHALPLPSTLPPNLTQRAGVVRLKDGTEDVFVLKDGTEIQADAIVFCTGYQYTFPFLDPSCGLEVRDNQVTPLYRHLVHARHPTMCLPGIPFKVAPFPCMDVQVRYFLGTLLELIPLPAPSAMLEEGERDRRRRAAMGELPRHYHMQFFSKWQYLDLLMADVGQAAWEEVLGGEENRREVKGDEKGRSGCGNSFSGASDVKDRKSKIAQVKRRNVPQYVRDLFGIVASRYFLDTMNFRQYSYEIEPHLTPVNHDETKGIMKTERYHNNGVVGAQGSGSEKNQETIREFSCGEETRYRREINVLIFKALPFLVFKNFRKLIKIISRTMYYKMKGKVYSLLNW